MLDEDEGGPSGAMAVKVLGIGAVIAVVLGLLAKGYLATFVGWSLGSFVDLARYASVGSWPVQRGYVQQWNVRYKGEGEFLAQPEFLYEVEGEVYKGWQPLLNPLVYRSEQAANSALAAFPIGKEARVRVNPLVATDAVLNPDGGKDWLRLGLRLAVACLILVLVAGAMLSAEVPYYAIALAMCGLLGVGGLCLQLSRGPTAQRAGISSSQLWELQAQLAATRAAWGTLRPGVLVSSAPAIGKPDQTVNSPGGLQTWIFDRRGGMETAGKLMVSPSTRGWVVDRAFPPYVTSP